MSQFFWATLTFDLNMGHCDPIQGTLIFDLNISCYNPILVTLTFDLNMGTWAQWYEGTWAYGVFIVEYNGLWAQ